MLKSIKQALFTVATVWASMFAYEQLKPGVAEARHNVYANEVISDYVKGLVAPPSGGGGCSASVACTAASFTTSSTSTALSFTSTATSTNTAIVLEAGARLQFNGAAGNRHLIWDTATASIRSNTALSAASFVQADTQVSAPSVIATSGGFLVFNRTASGAPTGTDCDNDAERGRFNLDITNNRLYICNGATRGWDYAALTD